MSEGSKRHRPKQEAHRYELGYKLLAGSNRPCLMNRELGAWILVIGSDFNVWGVRLVGVCLVDRGGEDYSEVWGSVAVFRACCRHVGGYCMIGEDSEGLFNGAFGARSSPDCRIENSCVELLDAWF